ncbi:hypothetical protein [Paenibacillus harenae]|uniref:hypothetical protein n=1 Tax=Paenibacillus harenae TaxID=306543 RepID=UPI0027D8FCD6|nr:hypothetical protein [Paenibacillus harenae]
MNYHLYHYFEMDLGPFRNLSKLKYEEAIEILNQIKREGNTFASKRTDEYMSIRRGLEQLARAQFIAKGGFPKNSYPHYMTLGECDWLKTWYQRPGVIIIPWEKFTDESISFTYGDLFPTMRFQDQKPYRKQVYTKNEIKQIINQFGFPQEWNRNGDKGPERYIEAQVWDEDVINEF